jgi:hypothetical protein
MTLANSNKALLIGGSLVLVGGIWAATAIAHKRKEERTKNVTAFYMELQRELAPDSVGLVESEAFDIQYWQNIQKKLKKKVVILKGSEANAYAETIRASWHLFNDDENKIFGVFRALKDQVAVSEVAYFYYTNIKDKKNQINLIDDLKTRLSQEEVRTIMDIVKKLPKYRLA